MKKQAILSMYNSIKRSNQGKLYGYIPLDGYGFALTNGHWVIRVNGSVKDFLPENADTLSGLYISKVNNLFNMYKANKYKITIKREDIVQHIKEHGRKKHGGGEIFTVPDTDHLANVFYLEYAFKLSGQDEITFLLNNKKLKPWYLIDKEFDMLLCPIRNEVE